MIIRRNKLKQKGEKNMTLRTDLYKSSGSAANRPKGNKLMILAMTFHLVQKEAVLQ